MCVSHGTCIGMRTGFAPPPEAKENNGFKFDVDMSINSPQGAYDAAIAEARMYREKRQALQESGKALSKSQSALVAQYTAMEKAAKGKAFQAQQRAAEREMAKAEKAENPGYKLPFT